MDDCGEGNFLYLLYLGTSGSTQPGTVAMSNSCGMADCERPLEVDSLASCLNQIQLDLIRLLKALFNGVMIFFKDGNFTACLGICSVFDNPVDKRKFTYG